GRRGDRAGGRPGRGRRPPCRRWGRGGRVLPDQRRRDLRRGRRGEPRPRRVRSSPAGGALGQRVEAGRRRRPQHAGGAGPGNAVRRSSLVLVGPVRHEPAVRRVRRRVGPDRGPRRSPGARVLRVLPPGRRGPGRVGREPREGRPQVDGPDPGGPAGGPGSPAGRRGRPDEARRRRAGRGSLMTIKPADPQAVVIFGASGDLTKRKLLPAFFHLFCEGLLPHGFAIVGYARSELTDEQFQDEARDSIAQVGRRPPDGEEWDEFRTRLSYVPGEFDSENAMEHLRNHLGSIDESQGTNGGRFFYCATPPAAYPSIVERLEETGMHRGSKIVIEKPFGRDLETARELNQE